MTSDLLGVIVPHYNQHDFLKESVESLENQDVNLVIVVIDDASPIYPDGEDLFSNPEHRFFGNAVNHGVQHCRNSGYSYLREECVPIPSYFLFSDADVIWNPGILKRMLTVLDHSDDDVGYVYCNYEAQGYLRNIHHAIPFDADQLRKKNFASTMSVIKAEAVPDPPFIADEERLQDWSLWLRLLNSGYRGTYIPTVGFTAHYNEASISTRGYDDFLYWKQIIRKRYVFNER